jgi:hypothetical protein
VSGVDAAPVLVAEQLVVVRVAVAPLLLFGVEHDQVLMQDRDGSLVERDGAASTLGLAVLCEYGIAVVCPG